MARTRSRWAMIASQFGGDRILWILLISLSVFSILVIFSSTGSMIYSKHDGDSTVFLFRQLGYVGAALFTAAFMHFVPPRFYLRFATIIYLSALGLVMFSVLSSSGQEYNSARRWVGIAGNLTFQPADALKIAVVIMIARALAVRQRMISSKQLMPSIFHFLLTPSQKKENIEVIKNHTLAVVVPTAVAALAVMANSLSTALIMLGTALFLFIIGRVRAIDIVRLFVIGVFVLVTAFMFMKTFGIGRTETWENRLISFVTPSDDDPAKHDARLNMSEDEFQKHQAQIAIASGWKLGKGPGNSTQRSNLPHPYSDYAYAFIVEEYSIIGGLFVLVAYLWIFYRGMAIFRKCRDPFSSLLVLGLALMITIQAFLHMCVSVGIAPVTGQTLPLISLGGTSLVFTAMAIGIMLGVSRVENRRERAEHIEMLRKKEIDEWSNILISEDEENNLNRDKSNEIGEYDGVIWRKKAKDNC